MTNKMYLICIGMSNGLNVFVWVMLYEKCHLRGYVPYTWFMNNNENMWKCFYRNMILKSKCLLV